MSFTAINLERLPAPQIIEQPDAESIFAARKARLIELAEQSGNADYVAELRAALEFESEPLVQLLQEDSYREMLLRTAVQDAGKGRLLAFAQGAMLDHLAAFYGVYRQVVQEADPEATPPVEEILEDDARLRYRVQLAPESFTTAGSEGSYIFWALSASPLVKHVVITSPAPKHVAITVLATEGNGVPVQELLDLVDAETQLRRPLTDLVELRPATIHEYELTCTLTLLDGPDAEVVRQASDNALRIYTQEQHRLGLGVTVAGLHAAAWQAGVQNVDLGAFTEDLVIGPEEAAYCTSLTIVAGAQNV